MFTGKLLKNSFTGTFGASFFIQLCTVAQGIVIARILGPEGRGEFAAVILWPTFFAAVGLFGTHIALAKSAARNTEQGPLFRTAILISAFTAAVAGLVCYVSIPFLMPEAGEKLVGMARLFILFIPLNHLIENLNSLDQGAGNFRVFNLMRTLFYPFYLVLIWVFWKTGHSEVIDFVLALLFANLLVAGVRFMHKAKYAAQFGPCHSLWATFVDSSRFGLAGMAEAFHTQADKALMLWLLGAENLGFYTVALSASLAAGSITSSAGMVVFTRSAQAQTGEGFDRVTKVFRVSALLWIVCGVMLALLMDFLLPMIYGRDFAPAIVPAQLLILGSAFAGLSNVLEQSLRGQGRAFVGITGKLAGLAVMSVLGFCLKTYGIAGLCLGYIVGQFVCLVIIVLKNNEHYKVPFSVTQYLPGMHDFGFLRKRKIII